VLDVYNPETGSPHLLFCLFPTPNDNIDNKKLHKEKKNKIGHHLAHWKDVPDTSIE